MKKQRTLMQLFVPIFFETLFMMIMGSVDTLMLSSVSDKAVGSVGASNTYLDVFTITFAVISSGMLAVMTQYIGAKKEGVTRKALLFGLIFNGVLGLAVALLLFFAAKPILTVLGIAIDLLEDATTYMSIVGASCLFTALTPIFTAYLRAFGYTKEPLIANIVANLANVVLNSVFLFGMGMGVAGVALATLISRAVGLALAMLFSFILIHPSKEDGGVSMRIVITNILRVGLPSAMENMVYNIAMAIVMKALNYMSKDGIYVTVRSYGVQIGNFTYCAGLALATANSIIVGWKIGQGKLDEVKKDTLKVLKIGLGISLGMGAIMAGLSPLIMRIFTDDPKVIHLVFLCLWIDVALESGRTSNLILGMALKTSGDAIFTVIIGTIFMFLFASGGSWLFGVATNWTILGVWASLAADESSRGLLMYLRWKSEKWKKKVLVHD